MKISIISLTLDGGGAEKVAVNLANYYSKTGYDVDLVLIKKVGPYLKLVSNNVNLVDLSSYNYFFSLLKLRSYLNKNNNNLFLSVIRSVNILIGLSSVGLKIKNLTFREANTLDAIRKMKPFKRFIYKNLMRYSYFKANTIIANSYDTKQDLIDENIIKDEKSLVIVNPVLPLDYQELLQKESHHRWLDDKNLKVILSVGRLHEQKNYPFLIECFAELVKKHNNTRLLIVGEGKDKEKLQSQIDILGMHEFINIENFQSNIFPYYKKSTVFALSSQWEGFGNVIVEALSAGTPVVSTNCSGGPKMILENGKYGTLVDIGNKKAYVDALCDKLQNFNNSKDMKLIEYSKKFSVKYIANEYLKVMKNEN